MAGLTSGQGNSCRQSVVNTISIKESKMPEKETIRRAQEDAREGKAPSTQAGEFVREEIEHVREGKHGVRSPQQAIAIGLSKARRAGVKLPPPPKGTPSARKSKSPPAKSGSNGRPSKRRSQAAMKALKREGKSGASRPALSRHAKQVAPRARKRSTATSGKRKRS
jgi:hypothetical protein